MTKEEALQVVSEKAAEMAATERHHKIAAMAELAELRPGLLTAVREAFGAGVSKRKIQDATGVKSTEKFYALLASAGVPVAERPQSLRKKHFVDWSE